MACGHFWWKTVRTECGTNVKRVKRCQDCGITWTTVYMNGVAMQDENYGRNNGSEGNAHLRPARVLAAG